MSNNKEGAAVIGAGVAACAVCCAGPIGGFLAAIGLGTAVGFTVFGLLAVVFGAVTAFLVLRRRRRQQAAACPPATQTVLLISGRPPSPIEPSSSSTGP